VVRYVSFCSECTHSKTPHTPLADKMLPPPSPLRPRSHLAVDFITDLPVYPQRWRWQIYYSIISSDSLVYRGMFLTLSR
ncbi:hypothetical protein P4O66_006305, partial [Electrophorus voltai]